MATNDALNWLVLLGLGGVAGLIGQAIRLALGIHKRLLAAPGAPLELGADASRIAVTLLIGAIAGALAAVVVIGDASRIATEQALALIAAGYAGADFVEGIVGGASRLTGAR
ncbi:hypothetical protein ACX40Y_10045 [Sphingomonas sp. RS6]